LKKCSTTPSKRGGQKEKKEEKMSKQGSSMNEFFKKSIKLAKRSWGIRIEERLYETLNSRIIVPEVKMDKVCTRN